MLNKDDDKWLANLDKADQDWLRGLAGEKVPGGGSEYNASSV